MDHDADPAANAYVGKVTIGGGLSYIVHTIDTNSTAPCVSKGPDCMARVDRARSNMIGLGEVLVSGRGGMRTAL
jgi:hypothetical protein